MQVPLSNVARFERSIAPLVINHQGQFPAVTISFGLRDGVALETATADMQQAILEMRMPDVDPGGVRRQRQGVRGFRQRAAAADPRRPGRDLLMLGVLYESLVHPLTIISTLPSAGLGALLALQVVHTELTIIAFIGIILLIGIVKKNGIMLVDFALEVERQRGLPPERRSTRPAWCASGRS